MSSPKYYDGEAVFVYPDESERLKLKEVPFGSWAQIGTVD
jgi:hypothetical protein